MDQHQLTILIAVVAAVVVIGIISFFLARKRRRRCFHRGLALQRYRSFFQRLLSI
jgi:predicted small integral membrane protein